MRAKSRYPGANGLTTAVGNAIPMAPAGDGPRRRNEKPAGAKPAHSHGETMQHADAETCDTLTELAWDATELADRIVDQVTRKLAVKADEIARRLRCLSRAVEHVPMNDRRSSNSPDARQSDDHAIRDDAPSRYEAIRLMHVARIGDRSTVKRQSLPTSEGEPTQEQSRREHTHDDDQHASNVATPGTQPTERTTHQRNVPLASQSQHASHSQHAPHAPSERCLVPSAVENIRSTERHAVRNVLRQVRRHAPYEQRSVLGNRRTQPRRSLPRFLLLVAAGNCE